MSVSETTHKRLRNIALYNPDVAADEVVQSDTVAVLKSMLLHNEYPLWTAQPKRAVNSGTSSQTTKLYAIIEAAQISVNLESKLEGFEVRHVNLLASPNNQDGEDYFTVAPYLIEIDRETKMLDWILENVWGKNAVTFYQSKQTLEQMHHHFKKFTYLYDIEVKEFQYFRHFNPRILRDLLPILKPQDLGEYLQGIEKIIVESRLPHHASVLPG